MKNKSYYYVYYVKNCSPKLKQFSNHKQVLEFVSNFKTNDESYVEMVLHGSLIMASDYYKRSLKNKSNVANLG